MLVCAFVGLCVCVYLLVGACPVILLYVHTMYSTLTLLSSLTGGSKVNVIISVTVKVPSQLAPSLTSCVSSGSKAKVIAEFLGIITTSPESGFLAFITRTVFTIQASNRLPRCAREEN